MNTRQIEYFIAVAEELNFTKAAEKMYVSQTAVTQQIRALEDQMNVVLFARTKKKVSLTPAGEAFYKEAASILDHIDNAISHAQNAASGMIGNLAIGFTKDVAGTVFPDRIKDFHSEYPNIHLSFMTYITSELIERMHQHELDCIFVPLFDTTIMEGVQYKILQSYPLVAVVPNNHVLASRRCVSRKDLQHEDLILACSPNSKLGEDKLIIDKFHKDGYYPNIVDKIEDIDTILLMVSLHMGSTIFPAYSFAVANHANKVTAIPFDNGGEMIDMAIVWRTDNENASLKKFVESLG